MELLRQWLLRPVGAQTLLQFAKFLGYKGAITFLSYKSLQRFVDEFGPSVGVVLLNSLITQVIEFLVLGNRVFDGMEKKFKTTLHQFIRFWIVVIALGIGEGYVMRHLLEQRCIFFDAYVVGHIPFLFTRFLLDRYWVFQESLTPRSKK